MTIVIPAIATPTGATMPAATTTRARAPSHRRWPGLSVVRADISGGSSGMRAHDRHRDAARRRVAARLPCRASGLLVRGHPDPDAASVAALLADADPRAAEPAVAGVRAGAFADASADWRRAAARVARTRHVCDGHETAFWSWSATMARPIDTRKSSVDWNRGAATRRSGRGARERRARPTGHEEHDPLEVGPGAVRVGPLPPQGGPVRPLGRVVVVDHLAGDAAPHVDGIGAVDPVPVELVAGVETVGGQRAGIGRVDHVEVDRNA